MFDLPALSGLFSQKAVPTRVRVDTAGRHDFRAARKRRPSPSPVRPTPQPLPAAQPTPQPAPPPAPRTRREQRRVQFNEEALHSLALKALAESPMGLEPEELPPTRGAPENTNHPGTQAETTFSPPKARVGEFTGFFHEGPFVPGQISSPFPCVLLDPRTTRGVSKPLPTPIERRMGTTQTVRPLGEGHQWCDGSAGTFRGPTHFRFERDVSVRRHLAMWLSSVAHPNMTHSLLEWNVTSFYSIPQSWPADYLQNLKSRELQFQDGRSEAIQLFKTVVAAKRIQRAWRRRQRGEQAPSVQEGAPPTTRPDRTELVPTETDEIVDGHLQEPTKVLFEHSVEMMAAGDIWDDLDRKRRTALQARRRQKADVEEPSPKAPTSKVDVKEPSPQAPTSKVDVKEPSPQAPTSKVDVKEPSQEAPASKIDVKEPSPEAPTSMVDETSPISRPSPLLVTPAESSAEAPRQFSGIVDGPSEQYVEVEYPSVPTDDVPLSSNVSDAPPESSEESLHESRAAFESTPVDWNALRLQALSRRRAFRQEGTHHLAMTRETSSSTEGQCGQRPEIYHKLGMRSVVITEEEEPQEGKWFPVKNSYSVPDSDEEEMPRPVIPQGYLKHKRALREAQTAKVRRL
ncbi:MAG: hypothetical protein KVP17_004517 [Porospora cf. gigantea B]|uniref:uncharacterized protein n=1 Tax=Porospora cf. gigantea B TaxID=2853592 RepID=UPI003571A070|nr:MAG: hypothetical protein KVP17_004517 [Porospora cf. gigantea B]